MSPRTPLPVRVEPHEDEAWSGYLGRVAAAHHMRLAEFAKFLGFQPLGTGRSSHRDSGIALTTSSRETFATALSLSEDAVDRMQLQRFNHRLLNLTGHEIEALDPLRAAPPSRPARFLRGRGWLRWRPNTHGCHECLRTAPDHWRLSWRVPWMLFCPLHQTLIDDLRAQPSTTRPTEALRAAQERMLEIAYAPEAGPSDGLFAFVTEVGAAVDLLVRSRDSSFHLNALADVRPSARAVTDVLPEALSLVDDARAGVTNDLMPALFADAEHQRRTSVAFARHGVRKDSSVRRIASTYLLCDQPDPWLSWRIPPGAGPKVAAAVLARVPGCVPQALPMDVFAGDLSDLLYPLPIEQGRTVAAVACVLVCRNPTLRQAVTSLVLPRTCFRPIYAELARLHAHGREDAFFTAAADAVTELARRNVDWAARRWPTHGTPHPLVNPMLKQLGDIAHPRVLRQWIHEIWASGYWDCWSPTSQLRTRRRPYVEDLDEHHHDELVAAAERAAASRPPANRRTLAS